MAASCPVCNSTLSSMQVQEQEWDAYRRLGAVGPTARDLRLNGIPEGVA